MLCKLGIAFMAKGVWDRRSQKSELSFGMPEDPVIKKPKNWRILKNGAKPSDSMR